MNYNDKKKSNIKMDDMDIKSHLNTSLDLSGIRVSEDLINRTLQAIKQQEESQVEMTVINRDEKKVIPWNKYIRGFAGVAAAAIIITVGYNAINNQDMKFKSKEDNSAQREIEQISEDNIIMEFAATESAAEKDTAAGDISMNATQGIADPTDAEFKTNDSVMESSEGGLEGQTDSSDIKAADPDLSSTQNFGDTMAALTIREILPVTPEQIEYILITKVTNNTEVKVTEDKDINDFYTMMDNQLFAGANTAPVNIDYVIEVGSRQTEKVIYTLTIGDTITLTTKMGDITSQSVYQSNDSSLLSQSLNDFVALYSR
jgi:hypothetical protein